MLRSQSRKVIGRCKLRHRPDRHGPHHRGGIGEQRRDIRDERSIAAVARRNQHIADEPVASDALDREPLNSFRNAGSSSLSSHDRAGARNASRATSFASDAVRANLFHGQTARQSSAAIDAVAYRLAEAAIDMALVLDGQVGDAAAGIEPVRRRKGLVGQMSRQARQVPQ